ncbi:MAG: hypothetical protein AB7F20_12350 [Geoalkalibacter sp.]|uniref:hypothetical protein n=1 Tax=Geoalkalibacter sp. TaxID=3041440 RepID=UPI003D0EC912
MTGGGQTPDFEKALALSVQHYREQLVVLHRIARALDDWGDQLVELARQWQDCAAAARLSDEHLLGTGGDFAAHHPMQQKRAALISQILELNKALSPRLQTAMALTVHELREMRGGRTALHGYKSPPSSKSRPSRSKA